MRYVWMKRCLGGRRGAPDSERREPEALALIVREHQERDHQADNDGDGDCFKPVIGQPPRILPLSLGVDEEAARDDEGRRV